VGLFSEKCVLSDRLLGYLEFLNLMANARLVLTDSGGIREETNILGIPCLTLRENTERPVTVTQGTNTVVGRVGFPPKVVPLEAVFIVILWKCSKNLRDQGDGKAGRVPDL
jgi:UDP-N-acetylglucosamine 2-epimerase (non-hydrolysing)